MHTYSHNYLILKYKLRYVLVFVLHVFHYYHQFIIFCSDALAPSTDYLIRLPNSKRRVNIFSIIKIVHNCQIWQYCKKNYWILLYISLAIAKDWIILKDFKAISCELSYQTLYNGWLDYLKRTMHQSFVQIYDHALFMHILMSYWRQQKLRSDDHMWWNAAIGHRRSSTDIRTTLVFREAAKQRSEQSSSCFLIWLTCMQKGHIIRTEHNSIQFVAQSCKYSIFNKRMHRCKLMLLEQCGFVRPNSSNAQWVINVGIH